MLTNVEKSFVIQLVNNWIEMSILNHAGKDTELSERAVNGSLWEVCKINPEKFEDVEREIINICLAKNQQSRAMNIIDYYEHNRSVVMDIQAHGKGKDYFLNLIENK